MSLSLIQNFDCRFAKVFDQWTECPTGERGGRWPNASLDVCPGWFKLIHVVIRFQGLPRVCSPKVAWLPNLDGEVHGISPNLGKLHQLSAPQGMVVSSTWHPLKGLENYERRKWQDMLNLQSTGIRSVMYFKLFHWFGHPDFVNLPVLQLAKPIVAPSGWVQITGVEWQEFGSPLRGRLYHLGGLNDRSAPFMIECQALQAYW